MESPSPSVKFHHLSRCRTCGSASAQSRSPAGEQLPDVTLQVEPENLRLVSNNVGASIERVYRRPVLLS